MKNADLALYRAKSEGKGVSRFFEPGPYSLQETYAARFVDWYLAELS